MADLSRALQAVRNQYEHDKQLPDSGSEPATPAPVTTDERRLLLDIFQDRAEAEGMRYFFGVILEEVPAIAALLRDHWATAMQAYRDTEAEMIAEGIIRPCHCGHQETEHDATWSHCLVCGCGRFDEEETTR